MFDASIDFGIGLLNGGNKLVQMFLLREITDVGAHRWMVVWSLIRIGEGYKWSTESIHYKYWFCTHSNCGWNLRETDEESLEQDKKRCKKVFASCELLLGSQLSPLSICVVWDRLIWRISNLLYVQSTHVWDIVVPPAEMVVDDAIRVLRFLQLLCEGHFRPIQQFLRRQVLVKNGEEILVAHSKNLVEKVIWMIWSLIWVQDVSSKQSIWGLDGGVVSIITQVGLFFFFHGFYFWRFSRLSKRWSIWFKWEWRKYYMKILITVLERDLQTLTNSQITAFALWCKPAMLQQ